MGLLRRINLFKIDYGQYLSYFQVYTSHLTLGIVAVSLGAVAIPAILEKNEEERKKITIYIIKIILGMVYGLGNVCHVIAKCLE